MKLVHKTLITTIIATLLLGIFWSSCMKSLLSVFTAVTVSTAPVINAEPDVFMSFDFQNGELERGFDDWYYSDKESNPCNVYNGVSQSKLCGPDGAKLYMYYNQYNNSHMGWTRYGFIDASNTVSVSGSSLKVQLNGGAYQLPNGDVEFRGIETRSKSDAPLDWSDELVEAQFEESNYLGAASLYIKGAHSEARFSNLKGKNRLSMWVLLPTNGFDFEQISSQFSNKVSHTLSWYPFINRSTGGHYYHTSANVPMGGWTKIQFDAHPSHHNGGVHSDYGSFEVGGTEYAGDGLAYFENITTMGLVLKGTNSKSRFEEYYIDSITTDYVEYENEETINNLGVGYDPRTHRFDISFEDKYRCLKCDATYQVRYSFEPINNANFNNAFIPQYVVNFNRQKSNTEGLVYKPNRGYNLLWAALDIQEQHKALLTENKKIYFAVKDLSTREFIAQQPVDFETVTVPNVGDVRKMDLVKTIEYEIIPVDIPLEIATTEQRELVVGEYSSLTLKASGGEAPYSFFSENLPQGLSIRNDGVIAGRPSFEESVLADVTVKDARGQESKGKLALNIVEPPPEFVSQCSVAVDFKDSPETSVFYDSRFSSLATDRYTKFVNDGTTISIGSNKNYDFTRLEGHEFTLSAGTTVRLVWKNVGVQEITFAPRISFVNAERVSSISDDGWLQGSELSLSPSAQGVSSITLDSDITSAFINTNVNYSHNNELVLDRIEIVESTKSTSELCINRFSSALESNSVQLIAEFKHSVIDSDAPLNGLNQIIKDQYTSITEIGSTITIGEQASYNYQGVKGPGYSLKDGDKVILTWFNDLDYEYTFFPRLSFSNEGRYAASSEGWIHLEAVTIQPRTTSTIEYEIQGNEAGWFNIVNVNTNAALNRGIYLTKIEFSESMQN